MYRIRKSRRYDNVFHIYRNKRKVGRITGGMESIVYIPARGKFVFKIYPGKRNVQRSCADNTQDSG